MRFVYVLSAVVALALLAVAMAPGSRTGMAEPQQGSSTRAPARSPQTAETEPEVVVSRRQVQQDNDGPDRTELVLWTLAAAGAAAVLALIGYFIRQRIGYFPHRPPPRDSSAPDDHH